MVTCLLRDFTRATSFQRRGEVSKLNKLSQMKIERQFAAYSFELKKVDLFAFFSRQKFWNLSKIPARKSSTKNSHWKTAFQVGVNCYVPFFITQTFSFLTDSRCGKGCVPFMEVDNCESIQICSHWIFVIVVQFFREGTALHTILLFWQFWASSIFVTKSKLEQSIGLHAFDCILVIKLASLPIAKNTLLLEGDHTKRFFKGLFGSEVRTFDFKWLRGIYRTAFTGNQLT